jgi:hypothetical protein
LWIACQNGHAATVATLHAAGHRAKINLLETTNKEGKPPALIAMELGCAEVIGVLFKAGADLRKATPRYDTMSSLHLVLCYDVRSFAVSM